MIVNAPEVDWPGITFKPGEYLVALNADLWTGFYSRAIGLEFRDTLSHLHPSGIELILLCRKPLDGTVADTILEHGTGGLHIDRCRVFTDWAERSESWKRSGNTAKPDAFKIAAPPGQGIVCHPSGRWPTNLVLTHAPGCKQIGTKKVKSGNPGNIKTTNPSTKDCYGKYAKRSLIGHADENNNEVTAAWACEDTCPVKALDEQSGELVSGGGIKHPFGTKNGFMEARDSLRKDEGPDYTVDRGGASRFYPQFRSREELLAWLEALTG